MTEVPMLYHSRARKFSILVAAATAILHGPAATHAQEAEPDCVDKDPRGNCLDKPLFPDKPPQKRKVLEIKIISRPPGATVYIDGEKRGVTPFTLDRPLSLGSHEFIFEKEDFGRKVITRPIRSFKDHEIYVELDSKPTLRIQLSETLYEIKEANVIVDDEHVGVVTPGKKFQHFVEEGAHQLRIESEGYHPLIIDLQTKDGSVYDLDPQLVPIRSRIEITSDIPDLPVYLVPVEECLDATDRPVLSSTKRTRVATTRVEVPIALQELTPNLYCIEVRITNDVGYRRWVTVSANETARVEFTFESEPSERLTLVQPPEELLPRAIEKCTDSEPGSAEAAGCTHNGWMYRKLGRSQRAASLYRMACDRKIASGCESLGWMLYHGEVKPPADSPDPRKYYVDACTMGAGSACLRLRNTRAQDARLDPADAHELHQGRGMIFRLGFGLDLAAGLPFASTEASFDTMRFPGAAALYIEGLVQTKLFASTRRWLQVGAAFRMGTSIVRADQISDGQETGLVFDPRPIGGLFMVWRTEHPHSRWSLSGGVGGFGKKAVFLALGKRQSRWRFDYGVLLQEIAVVQVQDTSDSFASDSATTTKHPHFFVMPYIRGTWSPTIWLGETERKGDFSATLLP